MIPILSPEILYEDSHIIVCHKPAGLPVQTARIGTRDLESILRLHLAGASAESSAENKTKARKTAGFHTRSASSGSPFLAVIHRLDQPVEGLLVFAKTPASAKELNRQLTSSGFGKYYRAVVCGAPSPSQGTLEDYVVKDARSNLSRICAKHTPGAKPARLHYKTTGPCDDIYPGGSLVEIRLDTGRHHQIRVQMAHLGCPIAGDRKYGSAWTILESDSQAIPPALMLCACRLEFTHPKSREKMEFEIQPWFQLRENQS